MGTYAGPLTTTNPTQIPKQHPSADPLVISTGNITGDTDLLQEPARLHSLDMIPDGGATPNQIEIYDTDQGSATGDLLCHVQTEANADGSVHVNLSGVHAKLGIFIDITLAATVLRYSR